MDRRTYEGHMDWEYQNSGPFDPTSPFTHAAQGNRESVFSSPSKANGRSNLFAATTPSKQQQARPQSSLFTPQLSSKNTGPAFRNPAFVTLQEQATYSDTSGAEDSPADRSNLPNDTPDADYMSDVLMTSPISPTRVDKGQRYAKTNVFARKHASGKGEIKSHRDYSVADIARKRKRHNLDRDVSSVVRYQAPGWDDSDSGSDATDRPTSRSRRAKKSAEQPRGWIGSFFHMLDKHPMAPDHIGKWFSVGMTVSICMLFFTVLLSALWTVQSDIRSAHEAERMKLLSEITECQNQYTLNECSKKDRPALKVMCDEWYDCMMQNPESIMKLRSLAKHTAEIINEFMTTLNLKAAGFILALIAIFVMAMFRQTRVVEQPSNMGPAGFGGFNPAMPPDGTAGYMYLVPTPRHKRQGLLGDDTDTDSSPPKLMPVPFTPSGRRSPSKGERSRSPVKYRRSPSKNY